MYLLGPLLMKNVMLGHLGFHLITESGLLVMVFTIMKILYWDYLNFWMSGATSNTILRIEKIKFPSFPSQSESLVTSGFANLEK